MTGGNIMQEERREVKRVGREVANKLGSIATLGIIALLVFMIIHVIIVLNNPIKAIEALGISDFIAVNGNQLTINLDQMPTISELEGEYVLSSAYVDEVMMVIHDNYFEMRVDTTILGKCIMAIFIILNIISLLSDYLFQKDCHYTLICNNEEDDFSVEFPDGDLVSFNRRFSINISKRNIQIKDGRNKLNLAYDKGAEQFLRRLQKE